MPSLRARRAKRRRAQGRPNILVVCTGNVCRSRYVGAVLTAALPNVTIVTAGTSPLRGAGPDERIVAMLSAQSVEIEPTRAQGLGWRRVRDADLIITATAVHRGQVVLFRRSAIGRTFTLKELARVATEQPVPANLDELLARAQARAESDAYTDADDDLDDPFGLEDEDYARMQREATAALDVLIPILKNGFAADD